MRATLLNQSLASFERVVCTIIQAALHTPYVYAL
jgi:hypothetical protein